MLAESLRPGSIMASLSSEGRAELQQEDPATSAVLRSALHDTTCSYFIYHWY